MSVPVLSAERSEDRMTPEAGVKRPTWRRVVAGALTALAGVLVFLALATPNNVSRLPEGSNTAQAFIRIPIEALIGIAVLLVLPARVRRVAAVAGGVLLGLLTVVKVIDMGFYAALARPFNPVLDWVLLDDGLSFLGDSIGDTLAKFAAVGAGLVLLGVPVLMGWAVLRTTRFAERHRPAAERSVLALSAAWVVLALLGSHFVSTVFISSDAAVTLARETAQKVPDGIRDKQAFAAEASVDKFRTTPPDQLLSGLAGKDVIFTFIESYGRSAVEDPDYAAGMDATLKRGTEQLTAAGYGTRSGWLTSPTAGGGSWLAHSTFQSGLWINNESRYRTLTASDRMTLTSAFGRGDWRTVGVEPGLTYAWPEGRFYGYDQIYGEQALNYHGPKFSWATMPDQFTLERFEQLEHSKRDRAPLMSEITFVSSHTPWAPIPDLVDWDQLGDGSIFGPMTANDPGPGEVWKDEKRVKAEYLRSVQYSVDSLVSYVQKYGDDDLVLVFLGDHQPSPIITGQNASRDVPISIVAKDPAVLDKAGGWQWSSGLKPLPSTPAARMDQFRDMFLGTFSR
ncbi:sulfatase [Actinoplanes sp. NPDC051470]|uniref:sulfatase n=1 Tax=unclassified Actinoplanes TaxID=2626549 RepID=UPI003440D3AD